MSSRAALQRGPKTYVMGLPQIRSMAKVQVHFQRWLLLHRPSEPTAAHNRLPEAGS